MRPHTCRTRSGAWASVHHAGTSRVHWSPSAPPPRVRMHPPTTRCGGERPPIHPQSASPSLLPPMCACTPPSASQRRSWVSICYHSPYCPCTTGSSKSRNPYKPTYFETADYGASTRLYEHCLEGVNRHKSHASKHCRFHRYIRP